LPGSSFPKPLRFGFSIAAIFLIIPIHGYTQTVNSRCDSGSLLALSRQLGIQAITVDSSGQPAPQVADTLADNPRQKSPLLAVLFSAVPGGGQIYNGSYWKVPIIWGVQAYFVSQWITNNKNYKLYQSKYSASITSTNTAGDATIKNIRNTFLDQRDSYAWYIAGTYLLSMLDAYVDAELSGFDVSPDLGYTPAGKNLAVSFRVKF
jgi:Family of unknown function (DUF5683)